MKLLEAIKSTLRLWLCPPEEPKEEEKPEEGGSEPKDPIDYNIKAPVMPTGNRATRGFKFLHPALRQNLEDALDECYSKGLMVYVFESYRTLDRQQYLYEQGRTREGRIVTNARPLYSYHNYGLAFDLVFDGDERDGIQWSWEGDYNSDVLEDDKRDDYTRVGEIFERYGYEWAARWKMHKETPHFQLPYGFTIGEAVRLYDVKGLQGVWDEITERWRKINTKNLEALARKDREKEIEKLVQAEDGVIRTMYDEETET